ncbi:MAG TPA: hypothetical protein VLJ11_00505 [Bryobacteraceae bacterium]|nr:hypothetical protein [Bryobacteraceae bacterium]
MTPRTKKNLEAATACDAIGSATYLRYAARARLEGDWHLAKIFQQAAEADRLENFAREADIQALISSTPNNLRKAIASEKKEMEMYQRFAFEAEQDGDPAAVQLFRRVYRNKIERCRVLESVLASGRPHTEAEIVGT